MTSKEGSRFAPVLKDQIDRRISPLDQLPPPANSNKPLTPFSIEDILSKPSVRRSFICPREKPPAAPAALTGRLPGPTSPLCALEELASKTFRGLEVSVLQAAEGRDCLTLYGQRNTPKKRRKSRTAFTNHQIYELEKRFLYQKYLSPADRDQIAQQLGLTNAQVITWFQNRRAKLKRDLEEMKADVESAKAVGAVAFDKLSRLAELEKCAAGGGLDIQNGTHHTPPLSPASVQDTDLHGNKYCSEEEDIDVDE
ncbi:transcription factor LBX1a [Sphaeramia orbicularis]|uniref:Transcription factor LBX1-like n=1 Tax=Sphaeramia orbicularis TaxID=375764 RepID=A0A672ZQ96_9TELE|nr:transcription factor LBX1-like [Sphaeramia orbicularis]